MSIWLYCKYQHISTIYFTKETPATSDKTTRAVVLGVVFMVLVARVVVRARSSVLQRWGASYMLQMLGRWTSKHQEWIGFYLDTFSNFNGFWGDELVLFKSWVFWGKTLFTNPPDDPGSKIPVDEPPAGLASRARTAAAATRKWGTEEHRWVKGSEVAIDVMFGCS